MSANNSVIRFIKDGLVGVAVALIIFMALIASLVLTGTASLSGVLDDLVQMFSFLMPEGVVGPMVFVILTAFIGLGLSGRHFDTITSRGDWMICIRKIAVASFLTGVSLFLINFGQILVISFGSYEDFMWGIKSSIALFFPWITLCGIGAVIGLIIGSLVGTRTQPQKKLHRLAVGGLTSAIAGYGVGIAQVATILLLMVGAGVA